MLSWCVLNGVHQNHWIFLSWFLLLLQLFFLISLCTYLYIFHCDITKLHSFHFSSVICMQIECLIYHNLHKSTVSGLRWNIVPADRAQIPVWALIEIIGASHTCTHTHTERPKGKPRDEWGYLHYHLVKSKTWSPWKPLYLDLRDGFGQSIKGRICTSEHHCKFVLWMSVGFFFT